MVGGYRRLAALVLLTVSSALVTGCTADFITEEARRSFASFLTGVFTTAVDGTIGP